MVLLVSYWILEPFVLRIIHAADIPEMPDLTGYPAPVVELIEHTYGETMDKPYADDIVGKLAMVYHANFFYEPAESCYGIALALNDREWLWYYYTALIKEELGDTKSTIENLQNVVEIKPNLAVKSQIYFVFTLLAHHD